MIDVYTMLEMYKCQFNYDEGSKDSYNLDDRYIVIWAYKMYDPTSLFEFTAVKTLVPSQKKHQLRYLHTKFVIPSIRLRFYNLPLNSAVCVYDV